MAAGVPAARAEVLKVATSCPLTTASAPVPRDVAPSQNVTVPGSVPAPGELAATVAVKVTDWANTAGFVAEERDVAVLSLLTVSERLEEVLVLKLESPA